MAAAGRRRTLTRRTGLTLGFWLCMLVVGSTAVPAGAHTALESSNPSDGATLAGPPSQVVLRFTEQLRTQYNRVVVRGPDGKQYQVGAPQVTGAQLQQPLRLAQVAGTYEVAYRVVVSDGHPFAGTVRFRLSTRPTRSAHGVAQGAIPGAPGSAGNTVSPWAVIAVVVLGCATLAALTWYGRTVTRDS